MGEYGDRMWAMNPGGNMTKRPKPSKAKSGPVTKPEKPPPPPPTGRVGRK